MRPSLAQKMPRDARKAWRRRLQRWLFPRSPGQQAYHGPRPESERGFSMSHRARRSRAGKWQLPLAQTAPLSVHWVSARRGHLGPQPALQGQPPQRVRHCPPRLFGRQSQLYVRRMQQERMQWPVPGLRGQRQEPPRLVARELTAPPFLHGIPARGAQMRWLGLTTFLINAAENKLPLPQY